MNYKQHLLLMGFLLVSMQALAQSKMIKIRLDFLEEKVVVEPFISKGTSIYKMPISPEGYELETNRIG